MRLFILLLIFVVALPSLTFGLRFGRWRYPSDCCSIEMNQGFQSIRLSVKQLNQTQDIDDMAKGEIAWKKAREVGDTDRVTPNCSQVRSIQVWSTENKSFTILPHVDSESAPVQLLMGNHLIIPPMSKELYQQLNNHLIKIDMVCQDSTNLLTGAKTDTSECTFMWVGMEVDKDVKELPPCLKSVRPPVLPPNIATSSAAASRRTKIESLLSTLADSNAAIRHAPLTPWSFFLGALAVAFTVQISFLLDAV